MDDITNKNMPVRSKIYFCAIPIYIFLWYGCMDIMHVSHSKSICMYRFGIGTIKGLILIYFL